MTRLYKDPDTGMRYPSVTTILGEVAKPELVGWAARVAAEAGDKGAPTRLMLESAAEGSLVHEAIRTEDWSKVPDGYRDQYDKAWRERPFEILSQETTVWSPTHQYAGTYDLVIRYLDDDTVAMVDVKTNAGGIREEGVRLQLAGYRHADTAPPTDFGAVLWLRPDKYEWRDVECDREEFEIFLTYRRLYEWRRA